MGRVMHNTTERGNQKKRARLHDAYMQEKHPAIWSWLRAVEYHSFFTVWFYTVYVSIITVTNHPLTTIMLTINDTFTWRNLITINKRP